MLDFLFIIFFRSLLGRDWEMGASIRYDLSLHQLSHVGVARKFRRQILLHSVVKKSDKARVTRLVHVLTSSNLMEV